MKSVVSQTHEQAAGHGDEAVSPALSVTAFAAALAAIAFFAWRMGHNAYTPDFPWLWRAGQHIVETGSLPSGDIFSWSRYGEPWVLYQWLFEVIVAEGERWLGLHGLFAIFTCLAVSIYLVAPLCGAVPTRVATPFVLIPGALGLTVVSINLSLRPMIVTSAFLLLQYVVVHRLRRDQCRVGSAALMLVPVYLLWGNMHTGVTLGLTSLALFGAGDFLERRRIYSFEPADPTIEGRPLAPSRYLFLITAAVLASLANPYGLGIYEYILDLSAQSYLNDLIHELRSPNFHRLRFQWFLLFVGGLLFFLTRSRRVFAAGDLLHLIVFTTATLHSARFIVWAILFYILVLPRAIHHERAASSTGWSNNPGRLHRSDAGLRAGAIAAAVLIPLLFWFMIIGDGGSRCDALRPAIAAYQTTREVEDRLFNDPNAGSCALAQDPDQRVFIDTRFDFYGTDFVREAIEALRLRPGWQQTLEKWNINAAIVEREWPLAQALIADPAFITVFEDENAVVLRRADPAPDPDRSIR